MTVQAIEHAVDRRANGVVIEMGPGKVDQRIGRLDLAFGLGDRLGPGADHHHSELGLGRMLLNLCLLDRLLRDEELLFGDLAAIAQGTEPIGGLLGQGHRQLGLLDGQLGGPPLLGAGERFEQSQRRLEPVSRRGLLFEIGPRDRRVELDDRLSLLDGVALRDQQFVNVPLDRRRERGDVVG